MPLKPKQRIVSIIDFFKRKYWHWQAQKGIRILQQLDTMMIKARYPRYQRRQFWREFIKRQSQRDTIYKKLRGKANAKAQSANKK